MKNDFSEWKGADVRERGRQTNQKKPLVRNINTQRAQKMVIADKYSEQKKCANRKNTKHFCFLFFFHLISFEMPMHKYVLRTCYLLFVFSCQQFPSSFKFDVHSIRSTGKVFAMRISECILRHTNYFLLKSFSSNDSSNAQIAR